ncbi:hypothetical protein M8C21_032328, partial [Ambrosia artemisiifolia]
GSLRNLLLPGRHMSGRKRYASGDVMEKTVERRQKRMIKNRESAARSRARKQAYTHELENKVSRLEEENERLRREKAIAVKHPFPLKSYMYSKPKFVLQVEVEKFPCSWVNHGSSSQPRFTG